MDRLIKRFDAVVDNDLILSPHRGVARQRDMTVRAKYDQAYFDYYAGLSGSVADRLNRGRIEFVQKHFSGKVLDIGIGCGAFVDGRQDTYGYDVNQFAVEWLKARGKYSDDFSSFQALTFWDVLEHVPVPERYLKRVPNGGYVFVAIPVFDDLGNIRKSKHYKPGEHLYYFTEAGFIAWMGLYGFRLVDKSSHEVDAGREAIGAFAFRRDLPGYRDFIGAYTEMHSTRHYGASARMYLDHALRVVKAVNPRSILDYGCGRSDLAAYFWCDGKRVVDRYDPAIPEFKQMPDRDYDLVFCCDVMEHIPMGSVDRVFEEIRQKSSKALFCISTKPARAKLPNGENAHVTLLTKSEWMGWISDVFGCAHVMPTEWPHVLMVHT